MNRRKADHPVAAKRKAAGLSGAELARKTGLTPSQICDIEKGRNQQPGIHVALRIADALGVDVRELFPQKAA